MVIQPLTFEYRSPKNDRKLWLATGNSRFATDWKNKQIKWSDLLKRLAQPVVTPESYTEYMAMGKAEQDKVKDVGGFVAGTLEGGRRSARTVKNRSVLTFDLDQAPVGFWEDYSQLLDYAAAVYSTHKHRLDKPRLRLLVPMSREVTPDEYEAVARMLATDIGMEYLDPSTFQPSRLMYWPSHSTGADYIFDYCDAPLLDPDTVLARYPGGEWHDASLWPAAEGEERNRKRQADKQQDPREKSGIIGAFCRTYTVPEAIDKFLSDVYAATEHADRYTYTAGSTSGGLVIYGDGLWAYSNHGTDPASGQLCNAFDLVRIHKFGTEDEDAAPHTPVTSLPSYRAMAAFCNADPETVDTIDTERRDKAREDFAEDEPESPSKPAERQKKKDSPSKWMHRLQRTEKGITASVYNCKLIFENDPALQGISYNELRQAVEIRGEPTPWGKDSGQWTDADDSELVTYISINYAEFPRQKITDQWARAAQRHRFNPVREYLDALPFWDGTKRLDTLLIDYLGAEDNVFTREATRKLLVAAVKRAYRPGCKFDSMLILSGPPNTGKSMLVQKLGGEYFSDNLTFEDMKDKTGAEKLQGYWILEISEMKGMRKMDVESIKAFISRQEDIYRAAYARNTERRPRQCILFGTVNNVSGYLKDITGNRRFWPIECAGTGTLKAWEMDEETRDQIWAEALEVYQAAKGNPSLILSDEAAAIAEEKQREALEADDREDMVADYLETLLPEDWRERSPQSRREWLTDDFAKTDHPGVIERTRVTNIEIWAECFGKDPASIQAKDSYDIARILKRLGWVQINQRLARRQYKRAWSYYISPEATENGAEMFP